MAQILYSVFRDKVRNWANRDATALPNDVIDDALFFGHDEANRRLKIPALEQRQFYYIFSYKAAEVTRDNFVLRTLTRTDDSSADALPFDTGVTADEIDDYLNGTSDLAPAAGTVDFYFTGNQVVDTDIPTSVSVTYPGIVGVAITDISNTIAFSGQELQLPIPVDTTTFISLRVAASSNSNHAGVVFNEKLDIRTYFDQEAYVRNANIWTRQGDLMHVIGLYGPQDIIELFYYKRLPDPDARYEVTSENFTARLLSFVSSTEPVAPDTADGTLNFAAGQSPAVFEMYLAGTSDTVPTAGDVPYYFDGAEVFNWLRDENQRCLLFGALYQCFDYLGDAEMKGTYAAKFASSIEELNEEEKKRVASGGNVQVNYSSYLLSGGAFF